jgi:type II secretory pathway pseudopilin PulG
MVELMVTLLIMSLLIAIAVPTYFGSRVGSEDRQAQSDLTNAIIGVRSLTAPDGWYKSTPSAISMLQSNDPTFDYTTGAVVYSSPPSVSVLVSPTPYILVLAEQSQTGRCWYAETNVFYSTQGFGGLNPAVYDGIPGVWEAGTTNGYTGTCTATNPQSLENAGANNGWQQGYPS